MRVSGEKRGEREREEENREEGEVWSSHLRNLESGGRGGGGGGRDGNEWSRREALCRGTKWGQSSLISSKPYTFSSLLSPLFPLLSPFPHHSLSLSLSYLSFVSPFFSLWISPLQLSIKGLLFYSLYLSRVFLISVSHHLDLPKRLRPFFLDFLCGAVWEN